MHHFTKSLKNYNLINICENHVQKGAITIEPNYRTENNT